MIVDQLAHVSSYQHLGSGVVKALQFLRDTNLAALPNGRHEVQGDQLYAMVQRYQPRTLDKIVWESHRKYIDVQYVVSGRERMGWLPLSSQPAVTKPYDDTGDAALYAGGVQNLFVVPAGFFALYSPQDIHAPGLAMDPAEGEVFKVVMKIRVAGSGPNGF